MKWFIAILVLAVILIAGCTQISSVACSPNWIFNPQGINEEYCKMVCYNEYKSNNFKMESSIQGTCTCVYSEGGSFVGYPLKDTGNCTKDCLDRFNPKNSSSVKITGLVENTTLSKCYCDVNNCNP